MVFALVGFVVVALMLTVREEETVVAAVLVPGTTADATLGLLVVVDPSPITTVGLDKVLFTEEPDPTLRAMTIP